MIELLHDQLVFSFPDVHPDARLHVEFQRTLRIPDDGRTYPLPPGLGAFPLRHVDDHGRAVPPGWVRHGGVLLPMYQAEALWLFFHGWHNPARGTAYPFAVKVAAGKVNAVTGQGWSTGLSHDPQDYLVSPTQPWLDGYCVEQGVIRQFVAMPLGAGYTAEEQLTGRAEHGGLQLVVYPMKRAVFERRFPEDDFEDFDDDEDFDDVDYAGATAGSRCHIRPMGLAPGGRMRQEVYADPFDPGDWDLDHASRCFVHLVNSLAWRAITGRAPPTRPPTAKDYARAGLPWFDYYDEAAAPVPGSAVLDQLKSVVTLGRQKGETPLPENQSCDPPHPTPLGPKKSKHQVREGEF